MRTRDFDEFDEQEHFDDLVSNCEDIHQQDGEDAVDDCIDTFFAGDYEEDEDPFMTEEEIFEQALADEDENEYSYSYDRC